MATTTYSGSTSSGGSPLVAEPPPQPPVLSLVCTTHSCCARYLQSFDTEWSNVLSMPPFVSPSANISRVSTQNRRRIIPSDIRFRTLIRWSLRLHSAGSHTSDALMASYTALASTARSNGGYSAPPSRDLIISSGPRLVPQYT